MKIKGGRKLKGEITLRGAKNAVPKIMVAALLTDENCVMQNVSHVVDTRIMSEMFTEMNCKVSYSFTDGAMEICAKDLKPLSLEKVQNYSGLSRIPTLTAGPMLARFGKAFLPRPGGCAIGQRPIDFHIMALEKMGAGLHDVEDGLEFTCTKLHGAKICLDYPSVGATEQILLSAVLADGVTEISNCAIEPEITDLILVLQKMGANIYVDVDRVIRIVGVEKLHGFEHSVIPDRIEAASWACAAMVTDGEILVRNARQIDMLTFLNKYREVGGAFHITTEGILFSRGGKFGSTIVETDVHPGFMTDWQQPFVTVLTQAEGISIVHETVYEDRFGYVKSLNKMGAKIQVFKDCLGGKKCRFEQRNHMHSAVISGCTPLHAAEIEIPDLRAGFTYAIAALAAEGESTLNGIMYIDRGYENFYEKLMSLGADVTEYVK